MSDTKLDDKTESLILNLEDSVFGGGKRNYNAQRRATTSTTMLIPRLQKA